MPELNKANRQTCDVDIRILKTMAPYLFFDTANVTTAGVSASSVYAMAKGSRRIAFQDPLTGTMTIEAQVYPFKFFALLSDGKILSTAVLPVRETIKGGEGTLTIKPKKGTVKAGTVFVFPEGQYGDETAMIKGTFAEGTFTAEGITADKNYEVGYMVVKDADVKRISFNNKQVPPDYFITMSTLDKNEDGELTPFIMTAYKATIQRNFELSFSSEGDPASVTLTFDLLEDKEGNILDLVEDTSEDAE